MIGQYCCAPQELTSLIEFSNNNLIRNRHKINQVTAQVAASDHAWQTTLSGTPITPWLTLNFRYTPASL